MLKGNVLESEKFKKNKLLLKGTSQTGIEYKTGLSTMPSRKKDENASAACLFVGCSAVAARAAFRRSIDLFSFPAFFPAESAVHLTPEEKKASGGEKNRNNIVYWLQRSLALDRASYCTVHVRKCIFSFAYVCVMLLSRR